MKFRSLICLALIATAVPVVVAVFAQDRDTLKDGEAYQGVRVKMGTGRTDELAKSKTARIYGEIMLLEERLRQSPPDGGESPNDVPQNE